MITKDFSKAPMYAQGTHVFFGGTSYTGIPALIRLGFVWRRVARGMRASPGYRGRFIWYKFPFTFGNFSLWDTRADMMGFAQSAEHVDAVRWLVSPGVARAAFVRLLRADPAGHSIGEWRAEDDGDAWRNAAFPFSSRISNEEAS